MYQVKKILFVCKKLLKNNIYIIIIVLLMSNDNDNNFDIINKEYFDNLPDYIAMKTAVWGPPTWFTCNDTCLSKKN